MTLRLTSSSLAGTLRKLVAVGTVRLRSMLAAIAAAAPFSDGAGLGAGGGRGGGCGRVGGPGGLGGVAGGGSVTGSAGIGVAAGRSAAGEEVSRMSPEIFPGSLGGTRGAAGAAPLPLAKNSRHDSLTESGSSSYCSCISSTSQELAPKPPPSGGSGRCPGVDVVVTPLRVVAVATWQLRSARRRNGTLVSSPILGAKSRRR